MPPRFNISGFDQFYRLSKTAAGLTGSLVKITIKPVDSKWLRVLTHVSCENKTNAFTKLRIGIDTRSQSHYLDELQTVAKNELVVSRSDILLGEGDVFFAEFTGTTTGDLLSFTCIGWQMAL
ncbi:MAG: hypothetical protein FVQ85_21660 [Planctomycetes bacterium]|nr:hypothetical protein [Planctomycetota bacterium]